MKSIRKTIHGSQDDAHNCAYEKNGKKFVHKDGSEESYIVVQDLLNVLVEKLKLGVSETEVFLPLDKKLEYEDEVPTHVFDSELGSFHIETKPPKCEDCNLNLTSPIAFELQ